MTRVKEGLILTPNQKFPLKINYGEIWVRGPRNVRGARTLGVRGLVRGARWVRPPRATPLLNKVIIK